MERCRYKQLNKQEYFQKHDSDFYRIIVKISMYPRLFSWNKQTIECNFPQVVKGRGLCSFVQLESNGDFMLYYDRVLGVNYD